MGIPQSGAKHPRALGRPGREVWAEIWGGIEPMFEQIRAGGPPVYSEDAAFVVERAGESENAWFTFSLSAVRDEAGEVVGVAMRTANFPPHPLFLLPMPDDAARELAQVLHVRGEEATGINGALPSARVCAEEMARLTGGEAAVGVHTRLFELGDLVTPPSPPGRLRLATEDDAERLLQTLPGLVSELRQVRSAADAAMARFRSSGAG